MAGPLFYDRVKETSTTTGTGTYTLAGAAAGFRTFAAVGDGNTCCYCAEDGTDWEVGVGTYTASGTTLSRDKVLASSNSGNAVNWGAGTRNVFLTAPAALLGPDGRDLCEGRLTCTSGTPVTTADASSATVYWAPLGGARVGLYDDDAGAWVTRTFAELSVGSFSASTVYDVFAYDNAGAVALEKVAWTNDTTRATALTTQDGVYVKSGDPTRRYLGSVRSDGSSNVNDGVAQRHVWNAYHQVGRFAKVIDTTNSWTMGTSWRQANNSSANQVEVLIGVAGALVAGTAGLYGSTANAQAWSTGIGDGDTTNAATVTGACAYYGMAWAYLTHYPTAGLHTYKWLEKSNNTTVATGYGDSGVDFLQSGMLIQTPM